MLCCRIRAFGGHFSKLYLISGVGTMSSFIDKDPVTDPRGYNYVYTKNIEAPISSLHRIAFFPASKFQNEQNCVFPC